MTHQPLARPEPCTHARRAQTRWPATRRVAGVLTRLALLSLILLLSAQAPAAQAQEPEAPGGSAGFAASAIAPDTIYATTITVNTSADLDPGSLAKTCAYTSGPFVAAGDGCTLRRALIEASARPPADRPIAIRFNLAAGDPGANLEVAGTWTLNVAAALPPLKTQSILNLNGSVTLDGATQPGGRTSGPRIIIQTNDFSLQVESENNIIRNLAFKGGGVIFLKRNSNTVTNVWMGLTDNGQSIAFRTPAQPFRLAGGGIQILSDNNTVTNNRIAGAFARAINIDGGDNNLVQGNFIGMRADGVAPVAPATQCQRSLSALVGNWYGGWGIALSGSSNRILNNRIAGLHIVQSANDTPPMAIEIFGANHLVQGNQIGVDAAGTRVGVCGQGIKVAGSGTQILDNVIVASRQGFEDDPSTAIFATDSSPLFGQITVRRNVVDSGPGNIYAFGPGVAQSLRLFKPARITGIDNLIVAGTAGDSSTCPNCLVDLYRDDVDAVGETLVYLGTATANAQGAFTFTLTQPLAASAGLRTASTPQAGGVIGGFGPGTTSGFSELYTAEGVGTGKLFLPLVKK